MIRIANIWMMNWCEEEFGANLKSQMNPNFLDGSSPGIQSHIWISFKYEMFG